MDPAALLSSTNRGMRSAARTGMSEAGHSPHTIGQRGAGPYLTGSRAPAVGSAGLTADDDRRSLILEMLVGGDGLVDGTTAADGDGWNTETGSADDDPTGD